MNIDFDISIGEYEVVASGVVITHLDKGIQFHIGSLTFDISFVSNQELDKPKIHAEAAPDNPKCLKIQLINYDDNFGKGLVYPTEVGTLGGKNLYLQFSTSTLGDTKTRSFEYTWFVK